jgi:hypothetical protein
MSTNTTDQGKETEQLENISQDDNQSILQYIINSGFDRSIKLIIQPSKERSILVCLLKSATRYTNTS